MEGSTATATLPRLHHAPELSAQTGIPLPRLYELVRRGLIPHVRIGRSVRFNAEAVARWIEEGGTSSHAA